MPINEQVVSVHGSLLGLDKDGYLTGDRHGVTTTKVTSAQLLALNATPQTVIPALGAGLAAIPRLVQLYKPAGTAYAAVGAGDDLVLKYTNGSGAQCSSVIEATGFLDQTTAETRVTGLPGSTTTTAADVEPVANAVVVLHLLTGEVTTGDSDLYVRVWYDVIDTVFTN